MSEPVSALSSRSVAPASRLPVSPLARRLAREFGLDLDTMSGSGPGGRIVKRDIEAARRNIRSSQEPKTAIAAPAAVLDPRVYAPDSYELVPLEGTGKIVAERLTAAAMHIPHFPLERDIVLDRLISARAVINDSAPDGVKISINDLLIKAAAIALKQVPDCNVSYTDKGIARHKSANISVAIATTVGLVTPVIRDADTLGLSEISRQVKDFAARARHKRIRPEEYAGGTFTISNLGMFGVKSFGSILNPPEAMILSVGAGRQQVIVDAKGEFSARTIMSVTLTCDHRAMGGAEGAKWLERFVGLIEQPATMLL